MKLAALLPLAGQLKLIQGGAYFNIHSAQFPGGEVRGQLIPRPIRLVATPDMPQEQRAAPTPVLTGVVNFGGAVLLYDPAPTSTNPLGTISVRSSLFLYNNVFSNSHIHEGPPASAGGSVPRSAIMRMRVVIPTPAAISPVRTMSPSWAIHSCSSPVACI